MEFVKPIREAPKPAVVQPIEESIDEGYTSEIQITVEEQPREEEIVVVLGQHTAQQVPQSKVQPVQEVVSEEYASEIQVVVEQESRHQEIIVEFAESTKEGVPQECYTTSSGTNQRGSDHRTCGYSRGNNNRARNHCRSWSVHQGGQANYRSNAC